MVKLWVSRVMDEPPNPALAAFRAARQALIHRLALERALRVDFEYDDADVEMLVSGELEAIGDLLAELGRLGLGNFSLDVERQEEVDALGEFWSVGSVELVEPEAPEANSLDPRLGHVAVDYGAVTATSPAIVRAALEGHVRYLDSQGADEGASAARVDRRRYLLVETRVEGDRPATRVSLQAYPEGYVEDELG